MRSFGPDAATERRVVSGVITMCVLALALTLIEPRLAAAMLGLVAVVALIGITVWSIDRLGDRLPNHGEPDEGSALLHTVRELPDEVDSIRKVLASTSNRDQLPGAVAARVRDLAVPRLVQEHHIDITTDDGVARLYAMVSPGLFAAITRFTALPPAATLPSLLDELERL